MQEQACPDVGTSDSDSTFDTMATFVPEACLFCNQKSSDFVANLLHMQKAHGLFIPTSIDGGALHLAVDMETLVGYMHLVILGYHECILCGTQKVDGWAVRQHMMGRGHCRIDLAGAESEWREFYEEQSDTLGSQVEGEDEDDVEEDENMSSCGGHHVHVGSKIQTPEVRDGVSLHLSSGKVVAHRTALALKNPHHKPLSGDKSKHSRRGIDYRDLEDFMPIPEQSGTPSHNTDTGHPYSDAGAVSQFPSSISPSQVQTMSRADRRRLLTAGKSALTIAVTQMSTRDRAALAHLSPAERRAIIVGKFKTQERIQTAERKYWSKFERRQDQPAEGGKVYIGGG